MPTTLPVLPILAAVHFCVACCSNAAGAQQMSSKQSPVPADGGEEVEEAMIQEFYDEDLDPQGGRSKVNTQQQQALADAMRKRAWEKCADKQEVRVDLLAGIFDESDVKAH